MKITGFKSSLSAQNGFINTVLVFATKKKRLIRKISLYFVVKKAIQKNVWTLWGMGGWLIS
jgi:hypothetical protein